MSGAENAGIFLLSIYLFLVFGVVPNVIDNEWWGFWQENKNQFEPGRGRAEKE